jgi:hypothetical protein
MSRDKQIAELTTDVSQSRPWALLLFGSCLASLLSTGLALGNGSGVGGPRRAKSHPQKLSAPQEWAEIWRECFRIEGDLRPAVGVQCSWLPVAPALASSGPESTVA